MTVARKSLTISDGHRPTLQTVAPFNALRSVEVFKTTRRRYWVPVLIIRLLLPLLLLPQCLLAEPAPERVRIYQVFVRTFGNTNETRKANGSLQENGSGKFAGFNAAAIAEIKAMGFTHVWLTGVLQQATATDYSAAGQPADDPDLLKGLAGSPYAVRDYFDVCPDYATDPAKRLEEFKSLVARFHEANLKVLIDLVPNHVARSYHSDIKPDFDFGKNDKRDVFFHESNNFFYLTTAGGPPLRLPTMKEGKPSSPTCVALGMGDGLFDGEKTFGRVTGNNSATWTPSDGDWYETVKLNFGYDYTQPAKGVKMPAHGVPDTWMKLDAILAYWQELGVEGFRCDMAHMVPPEFWKWAIDRARQRDSNAFFAAEAYDSDPAKVSTFGTENVMAGLLKAGFDTVYDDPSYDILKEIYDGNRWANDLDRLAADPAVFEKSLRYAENHDEVRLAGRSNWGDAGMLVGRPVSAVLFALSGGPVMIYAGQEVGEPGAGVEGFGGEDARTSIFDYWSMPEFTKWVNGGAYDGAKLSEDQLKLREFYRRLLHLANQPAFRSGTRIPLNPANLENPNYGRLPGETASGHWLYAMVRRDAVTGQCFLVVANFHKDQTLRNVRIQLPPDLLAAFTASEITLTEKLADNPSVQKIPVSELREKGALIAEIPPLTALALEFR